VYTASEASAYNPKYFHGWWLSLPGYAVASILLVGFSLSVVVRSAGVASANLAYKDSAHKLMNVSYQAGNKKHQVMCHLLLLHSLYAKLAKAYPAKRTTTESEKPTKSLRHLFLLFCCCIVVSTTIAKTCSPGQAFS
jgi:hypothetical protein